MSNRNSKDLWLQLEKKIQSKPFTMGPYTSHAFTVDPAVLVFLTSRYKFCAKMLSSLNTVLEIGCGDGFGGAIVAQRVNRLICTDINKALLSENQTRMERFANIEYHYHDFRKNKYPEKVDGIFLVDVIEHIFADEEPGFLENLADTLGKHGVCLIGTPNETSKEYANKFSKKGHINLKNHKTLKSIGDEYFHNSFLFGMNDEVVHTSFPQMAQFLWLMGVGPKKYHQDCL